MHCKNLELDSSEEDAQVLAVVVGLQRNCHLALRRDDLPVFGMHFDSSTNNLEIDLGLRKVNLDVEDYYLAEGQGLLKVLPVDETQLELGHTLQGQDHTEEGRKSIAVADCFHLELLNHPQCFHILENSRIRAIGRQISIQCSAPLLLFVISVN